MEHKPYASHKSEFDKIVFNYLVKRVLEDIKDTDAAKANVIDGVGNILRDMKPDEQWMLTDLDRFIMVIKNAMGQEKLSSLLKGYSHLKDIDSPFLLNAKHDHDFKLSREGIDKILSKVEDRSYLPEFVYREDKFVDDGDDEESFKDRMSKAFTILTHLLYGLRNDRQPNKVDFQHNICPSTEITFGILPHKDFEYVTKFCQDYALMQPSGITKEGLRLLADASRDMVNHKLLCKEKNRVENQSHNWEKLSKI
jgi:hypothetical protein